MISFFYNKHRHLSISPKGRAHDRPAMLERVGRGPFQSDRRLSTLAIRVDDIYYALGPSGKN